MKKMIAYTTLVLLLNTTAFAQNIEVGSRPNENPEKLAIKVMNAEKDEERIESAAYYYNSTHPGAYHQAIGVSHFGETIELEDGSIWSVAIGNRFVAMSWLMTDRITISPNTSWFGTDFILFNETTGESVEADLRYGPVLGGLYTYQITSIDYIGGIVYLQDSSWAISFSDEDKVYKWLPGDTVIIGHNTGWNASIRPNILINVNVNDYACANCIAY